jgi:hypothetical protein
MRTLVLNVTGFYFSQIDSGKKPEEYRLCTPFWKKRIENKKFDCVEIRCGYPKKGDTSRIICRPYTGWTKTHITHKHFGETPVHVFAIHLTEPIF